MTPNTRRRLAAVAVLAGVLAACGGSDDDTTAGGGTQDTTAVTTAAAVGSDDDGGVTLPNGTVIDGDGDAADLEAIEELIEYDRVCEILPIDEVTALITDKIGDPGPLEQTHDRIDNCAYSNGGPTNATTNVSLERSTKPVAEVCEPGGGNSYEFIEGLGDGVSCRVEGGYRSASSVLFSVGDYTFTTTVLITGNEAWSGDVLGRSEAGWEVVEGFARLVADQLT